MKAVENNVPLAGLWAPDHNQALIASLRLGCCAFPNALEPLGQAHWVVYSDLPENLPPEFQGLDVRVLQVEGTRVVVGESLSESWNMWLRGLGFEIA